MLNTTNNKKNKVMMTGQTYSIGIKLDVDDDELKSAERKLNHLDRRHGNAYNRTRAQYSPPRYGTWYDRSNSLRGTLAQRIPNNRWARVAVPVERGFADIGRSASALRNNLSRASMSLDGLGDKVAGLGKTLGKSLGGIVGAAGSIAAPTVIGSTISPYLISGGIMGAAVRALQSERFSEGVRLISRRKQAELSMGRDYIPAMKMSDMLASAYGIDRGGGTQFSERADGAENRRSQRT